MTMQVTFEFDKMTSAFVVKSLLHDWLSDFNFFRLINVIRLTDFSALFHQPVDPLRVLRE